MDGDDIKKDPSKLGCVSSVSSHVSYSDKVTRYQYKMKVVEENSSNELFRGTSDNPD